MNFFCSYRQDSQCLSWAPIVFAELGRGIIYVQEAGVSHNDFRGAGEQSLSYEDLGSPAKMNKLNFKNLTLNEKPRLCSN